MFTINPHTNRIAPLEVKRFSEQVLLVCGLKGIFVNRFNSRKKTP